MLFFLCAPSCQLLLIVTCSYRGPAGGWLCETFQLATRFGGRHVRSFDFAARFADVHVNRKLGFSTVTVFGK